MQETGFVFLHGAGLGSWLWDSVIRELAVPCVAVDFPHREAAKATRANLTLDDYVKHVVERIAGWEVPNVVIVAHSLGGVVGVETAKAIGDRLAGFVAVSAIIPKPGGSFVSSLPFPQRLIMPVVMRVAGTQPPDQAIRNSLGTGLSEAQISTVVKRFSAEAVRVYTDRTSTQPLPNVRCLYVKLTADREIPPALQASMAQRLPAAQVVELAAGHLPMISHPVELSAMLRDFVEG